MAHPNRQSVSKFLLVVITSFFSAHTTCALADEPTLDDFVKLCVETEGDKPALSRAIAAMTPPYVPNTLYRLTQDWIQESTKRHLFVIVDKEGLVEECMLTAGLDNIERMARSIQVRFAPTKQNGLVQFDDVSVSLRMTAVFGLMEGLFTAHAKAKPTIN
jgi:hypothetical protein